MPNRNNERALDLVLERLQQHTTYPDFELVIVDDGSTDGSRPLLRSWRDRRAFERFELIELEHGGVVEALNTGLATASGKLVVQLDADASVETPAWLERLVDFHESDERVGSVTGLVAFEDGLIHAAGLNLICREGLHDRGTRPSEPTGRRTVHTRVTRTRLESAGELARRPAEVDAAIGVCMLYARAAAEEAGGYDVNFSPVWFDDLDLSLSIRRAGLKSFCLPEVRFIHRMSLRGSRRPPRPVRDAARRAAAAVLPTAVTRAIVRVENRNTPHPPHELRRLRHHYGYWREKWGFDLINPDMQEVRRRYGKTEVCWAYDAERRAAGERIAAGWSSS